MEPCKAAMDCANSIKANDSPRCMALKIDKAMKAEVNRLLGVIRAMTKGKNNDFGDRS